MIGRRGFLKTLIAGAVLDPERALWKPGAKLISIAAPPILRIPLPSISDYESLFVDVMDRMFYGYYRIK